MLISPGGADRPETFPPELPINTDAELHLRSLPHGAWAGVVLPWRSRRAPEYSSSTRGYCRVKLRNKTGGITPSGYMGTSTSFVLFIWGKIQGGRPVKWLLHARHKLYAGDAAGGPNLAIGEPPPAPGATVLL